MKTKVPVSARAVVQRINRKLRADDKALKKTRGGRAVQDLGEFFVIDFNRNTVLQTHVDPEEMGRELGLLQDYEAIIDK